MTYETEGSLYQKPKWIKNKTPIVEEGLTHEKTSIFPSIGEISSSMEIRKFKSCDDVKRYLDEEISRVRNLLQECFSHRQEVTLKVDSFRKIISKLAGEEITPKMGMHEIDLQGLKIVVNPDPEDELELFNFAVKSLESKLHMLENIHKVFAPLSNLEEGVSVIIIVALSDGVPIQIVIKIYQ